MPKRTPYTVACGSKSWPFYDFNTATYPLGRPFLAAGSDDRRVCLHERLLGDILVGIQTLTLLTSIKIQPSNELEKCGIHCINSQHKLGVAVTMFLHQRRARSLASSDRFVRETAPHPCANDAVVEICVVNLSRVCKPRQQMQNTVRNPAGCDDILPLPGEQNDLERSDRPRRRWLPHLRRPAGIPRVVR